MRWPSFRFQVKKGIVQYRHIASVFWGFYESAEIRFIEKYLKPNGTVVELGGSTGVVSTHIASRMQSGKLLIVEANPQLIDSIQINVSKMIKSTVQLFIENSAIGYSSDRVALTLTGNTTESQVAMVTEFISQQIIVPAMTLGKILGKYEINDDYTLVCDIEGSELAVFLEDTEALKTCQQLFVELHESEYHGQLFTVEDQVKLIEQRHQFIKLAEAGPVFYFGRS